MPYGDGKVTYSVLAIILWKITSLIYLTPQALKIILVLILLSLIPQIQWMIFSFSDLFAEIFNLTYGMYLKVFLELQETCHRGLLLFAHFLSLLSSRLFLDQSFAILYFLVPETNITLLWTIFTHIIFVENYIFIRFSQKVSLLPMPPSSYVSKLYHFVYRGKYFPVYLRKFSSI